MEYSKIYILAGNNLLCRIPVFKVTNSGSANTQNKNQVAAKKKEAERKRKEVERKEKEAKRKRKEGDCVGF